jgi:hypothetical protein
MNESASLLSQLDQMRPFALTMPMVPSAAISPKALQNITVLLDAGHRKLKAGTNKFIDWLENSNEEAFSPEKARKIYNSKAQVQQYT